MKTLINIARNVVVFGLASLAALAVFGVALALFQATLWNGPTAVRIALTLISAGLGFLMGGFLAARLSPPVDDRQALAFGILFGGFSFVYIFGPGWGALVGTLLAILLAAAGARISPRRSTV